MACDSSLYGEIKLSTDSLHVEKLIVNICYQQAFLKLFLTSCNKSANDKFAKNLIVTDLLQLDEIDKFVATCWQVSRSR